MPTETDKVKFTRFGTLGCLILSLLLSCLAVVTIRTVNLYALTVPDDPDSIAFSFAGALYDNNVKLAQALTEPTLWPEIDRWVNEHQVINCYTSFEDAIEYYSSAGPEGGTGSSDPGLRYRAHIPRWCTEQQTWYCFSVHGIILEQREGKWVITKWGKVIEIWDSSGGC